MKNDFDNRPIGIFDSGIGGLTVLKQLVPTLKNEEFIYIADTLNLPYGEKTKDELKTIIKKIFDYFEKLNVKAVIMACNTSSAQVYDELKGLYKFQIYPIIQITSKCITENAKLKRLAVFATNATINSHAYANALKSYNPQLEVYEHSCPEWVPIVEKKLNNCDKNELILKYLKPALEFKPQAIILGCTHYPYLLDRLSNFANKEIFIDPALPFADYIIKHIPKSNNKSGSLKFLSTSDTKDFKEKAGIFFEIKGNVELLTL